MAEPRQQEPGQQDHESSVGLSRTSQVVAVTRSGLSRRSSPNGDPDAQSRLCAGMDVSPSDWLRPALAARTRFFDDHVLEAISAGVAQIVVIGAGYDDRALRFRTPGVRFYEIDHPSTQVDKVRRLQTMGVPTEHLVLSGADFRCDDLDSVLARCGHDARSDSLFICEGVLVYLELPSIVGLLASLRARSGPDSTLAASLAVHSPGVVSKDVAVAANARRRSGVTEPWRTILSPDVHLALLQRAGWHVDSAVDAAELQEGVKVGRSLLVSASSRRRHSAESKDGGSRGRDPS
jgi:methyltransferase (TIGR00027 family)